MDKKDGKKRRFKPKVGLKKVKDEVKEEPDIKGPVSGNQKKEKPKKQFKER
jgi:hypothetical protein